MNKEDELEELPILLPPVNAFFEREMPVISTEEGNIKSTDKDETI